MANWPKATFAQRKRKVDEAHLLGKEMLEEIRFLLNFKMDSQSPHDFSLREKRALEAARADIFRSLMALILSGQTELWDKLKLQSYAAIPDAWASSSSNERPARQRVDVACVIGRLDRAQTTDYVFAQLSYAGSEREIFTDAAIDEVFKFSGGIPRLINRACADSLLFGAQNRKNLVDDRMVKTVVEQEIIGGIA